jgi:OOP family OmpA-OmpF porin
VYTEGKGKANPIADNRTREGRAKNRRVELEVVGTRN